MRKRIRGVCAGYNRQNKHSKIRALMNYSPSLLISLALLAATPAFAEKADRDKPMNAEADALRYDDLKQSSVFTGNVIITKGTTVIRGARVDVSQDALGYQQAVAIAEPGKLAYYRTKRDGVDEIIEGEGERIEYDGRADNVKFIRQAVMRRYVAGKLADESQGELIRYENTTDVFSVDGSVQPRPTASNPSGRVRVLLSPRSQAPAVAAGAPSAPATGATAPAGAARPQTAAPAQPLPGLRSSPTLSSDKK
jgi:lipopolysaccharide export system protein LptA